MQPTLAPHRDLHRYYSGAEQKSLFLRGMFDRTAADYERVERVMSLGTGSRYRREALLRAGLRPGMRVLDVAAGTGMVTREAIAVVGSASHVVALDPSGGMLERLVAGLSVSAIRATGERLPLADESFDFLSMGFALRHLSDLRGALREFRRVLVPGGSVCMLEITPPAGRVTRILARCYLHGVVPCLTRLAGCHVESSRLWRYYWDTIDACISPQTVLEAIRDAGFADAARHIEIGVFSEYTGRKS